MDGTQLVHVLFWMNQIQYGAKCRRKVVNGRKVVGSIKSLVNGAYLHFECVRMLHDGSLGSVLLYGSKTLIWRERFVLLLWLCRCTTVKVYWALG